MCEDCAREIESMKDEPRYVCAFEGQAGANTFISGLDLKGSEFEDLSPEENQAVAAVFTLAFAVGNSDLDNKMKAELAAVFGEGVMSGAMQRSATRYKEGKN